MRAEASIDLILSTARHLIPGLVAKASITNDTPGVLAELRASSGTVGIISGRPNLSLLVSMEGMGRWILDFSRPSLPLSTQEWDVLGRLPDAVATLLSSHGPKRRHVAHQISSRLSLEHVLVAQTLRRVKVAGFWWPMTVMETLIELTFRRYEGQIAATGIVFTSKDNLYTAKIDNKHPYALHRFTTTVPLGYDTFSSPASFRYVDGRNSFFLLDKRYQIIGVLRARSPESFSIIDRCSLRHVYPLVRDMPGRVWLAYVGLNSDVQVLLSSGLHLQWQNNHWRVRDDTLVASILRAHGCDLETVTALLGLFNALSELRHGALVLIPDGPAQPTIVGKIDNSAIAASLRVQIQQVSIADLISAHAAIGVLASDGLTTISKTGQLLSCGDILDLGGRPTSAVSGGGRSQAARAASAFGLAIKVSEDGPLSIYKNGTLLVSI